MTRTEDFLDNYSEHQSTEVRGGGAKPGQGPLTALAIDGGGVRGLVPARVLEAIEMRTGRPLWTGFDLISGTSTGGLIALALTAPGDSGQARWTPGDMVKLYREAGKTIFHRGLLRIPLKQLILDKYGTGNLERELHARLDPSTVGDAMTDIVITSWNLSSNAPAYFNSAEAGHVYDDVPMWQVARATSAAPSYFSPCWITESTDQTDYAYIDGGVFANDPAKVAYLALRQAAPNRPILLVSIGCGDPQPFKPTRDDLWGALPWAERLVHLFMTAPAELVEVELSSLVGRDFEYYRFAPELGGASPKLDDCSDENIKELDEAATALIEKSKGQLDKICERLRARSGKLPPS